MERSQPDKELARLAPLVADIYSVDAVYRHGGQVEFSLTARYERSRSVKMLKDRLEMAGYDYKLSDSGDGPLLLTIDPKRKLRIPWVNVALFLITLATVYIVPVYWRYGSWAATKQQLLNGAGIEFTLAMISILFVHEMGHFVAGRRRNIVTSWPYFIPAPTLIGTFGAVIKSKSPFWNRRDLIEVGAAGPIAGWIVALIWLAVGLAQSRMVPTSQIPIGELAFSLDGESILMRLLVPLLVGDPMNGWSFILSEGAFAGWVGMLVTAINLLPIGQLDGGHITYGLVRERQKTLGWVATALLIALGFQSSSWWVFAAFGLVFGVAHPPTMQDERVPSRISQVMGVAALIILILSFTPVPFRA
ncbi:MAG: site-2 protease family protein [candidate division Zixibacteria bacterium]|nr:site-2 protease family protein [candidate division Zixibacteria bacterium]